MTALIYQVLLGLFGGTSAIQFYLSWKTRSSNVKKEESLAIIEQANSISKAGDIYSYLTSITEKELEKMNKKIDAQDIVIERQNKTIGEQQEEIKMLHEIVSDYKIKCDNCPNKL